MWLFTGSEEKSSPPGKPAQGSHSLQRQTSHRGREREGSDIGDIDRRSDGGMSRRSDAIGSTPGQASLSSYFDFGLGQYINPAPTTTKDISSIPSTPTGSEARFPTLSAEARRMQKIVLQESENRNKAIEMVTQAIRKEEQERMRAVKGVQQSIDDLWRRLQDMPPGKDFGRMDDMHIPQGPTVMEFEEKISTTLGLLEDHRAQVQALMSQVVALTAQAGVDTRKRFEQAPSGRHSEGGERDGMVELISSLEQQAPAWLEVQALGARTNALEAQRKRDMSEIQASQNQQAMELSSVRNTVAALNINVLLHSLQANKIALRSVDVSREEREAAIKSLEAKEQLVREGDASVGTDISFGSSNRRHSPNAQSDRAHVGGGSSSFSGGGGGIGSFFGRGNGRRAAEL